MEFVKVLIVGGGAAGLAAAKTFESNGIDYVLLEAQDYLGGRIRTVDADENLAIDLGAQYIHGEKNNFVYSVFQQLNRVLPENEKNFLVLTSDQESIDPNLFIEASEKWEEFLYDARAEFVQRSNSSSSSFGQFFRQNFPQRLSSLPNHLISALIHYFDHYELIENGCATLDDLSLAEYGSFEYLDGCYDTQLRPGGYRPLINYFLQFISDSNRIRLNNEVISVKFNDERHQLEVQVQQKSSSEIQCFVCDHLIWTSSLGFLKANLRSIFANEHRLIEQKQSSIEHLGFDTINKVVLIYDERFWPENVSEIVILHTNDRCLSSLSVPISIDSLRTIVESIDRFDVFPSSDRPVLICWFAGRAAILSEDLSETTIGTICHEVLSFHLNLSATERTRTAKPRRVLKSEWNKNRFIRGSYSYYSTKSSSSDGESLRHPYEPDGIPRILFAGEATHETFYSTVHGAIETGIREATRLAEIILKKN